MIMTNIALKQNLRKAERSLLDAVAMHTYNEANPGIASVAAATGPATRAGEHMAFAVSLDANVDCTSAMRAALKIDILRAAFERGFGRQVLAHWRADNSTD